LTRTANPWDRRGGDGDWLVVGPFSGLPRRLWLRAAARRVRDERLIIAETDAPL
jgi:hypothetical protein